MRAMGLLVILAVALPGCLGNLGNAPTDAAADEQTRSATGSETAPATPTAAPVTKSSGTVSSAPARSTPAPAAAALTANVTLTKAAKVQEAGQVTATVSRAARLDLNGTIHDLAKGTNLVDLPLLGLGEHRLAWAVTQASERVTGLLEVVVAGEPLQFPSEPTASHTIRPGILSEVCTTNFIFHHLHARYFIGTAAHCIDGESSPNGSCSATQGAIGATEQLEFGVTAKVAYSSWTTMNRVGVDAATCDGNDFGLLEVAAADWPKLHPKVHGIVGHVTGLGDCRTLQAGTFATIPDGTEVVAYGRSNIRGGVVVQWGPDNQVDDKEGWVIESRNGGYTCHVYLATPGIPGDSGGPLALPDGKALGVASTVYYAPDAGSNDYTNIIAALEFMREHEGWAPELVLG